MPGQDSEEEPEDDRRRYRRRPLLWEAVLQCGAHEFDVWVYDISLGGAKVRFDLPLNVDCGVVLDIRNVGAVSGRVVWSKNGQLGIEFFASEKKIIELIGEQADHFGMKLPAKD